LHGKLLGIITVNHSFRLTSFYCDNTVQVRDKAEPKLKVLEHVCGLLKAAEGELRGFQENLVYWERINTQKCKTPRELQVQVLCLYSFLKTNEEIM